MNFTNPIYYPICNKSFNLNHPSFDRADKNINAKQTNSLHGECKTFTKEEIKSFCEENNLEYSK